MTKTAKAGIIVGSGALVSAASTLAVLVKASKHFSERLSFRKSKLRLCGEM